MNPASSTAPVRLCAPASTIRTLCNRALPFLAITVCGPGTLLFAQDSNEGTYLANIRQLTFEGKRSGEGYFSADGRQMVFQSEREEGNPFYQIYLMDLDTGDQERISPGAGKTTCAWIHPDGERILFASTHEDAQAKAKQDAEIQDRQTNRVRKYSWDYDEHYDLFEFNLKDRKLRNLSHTPGYDAEGCYSPDGKKIVFASNRAAYTGSLTAEEQERLKTDKQFFMDIYVCDADGGNARRLTDVPGYDGGPFFSADGKRICWRRFTPKGDVAEVWTMNADGSGQRQITRLGAMSWAPYFHPSGDYLIFTTNLQGFANFELYVVDAAGKRDPVRITTTDGFDGLPVFTPDGSKLAWTSGRTAGGQSQIFIADWNDAAARRALKLDEPGAAGAVDDPNAATPPAPDFALTAADIRPDDLRQHVTYLASDELEGRQTGTRGEQLATAYAADIFEKIGLLPYGDDQWFDPFEFTAGVALGSANKLTLTLQSTSADLVTDQDWRPLSFSQTGAIPAGGIVFAGYGIETPEEAVSGEGKRIESYSSYAHLDVKDKWVMVLRYLPEGISQDRRNSLSRYSSLRYKALTARQRGARGLIVVSGPNSKVVEQLVPMAFDASLASSGIPAISVTDAIGNRILKGTGKTLKELQDKLDTGELMGGFDCAGVAVAASKIDIQQEKKMGRNVLAVLPAQAQPNPHQPAVIVGAHIDHLGTKGGSSSRAKGDAANQVHHGADDNASGVAGVIEIAQWLADQKRQGKVKLTRDIIFAAWSGEEIGLLGSNHYAESLAKMIRGDANGKLTGMFAACLNMDMIGRFNKTLVLQGVGSSSWWPREIEKRNAPVGLPITTQNDAHLPTDSTAFYLRGIPTLNAFTGAHEDYHMPSDTADKLDYARAADIARLMGLITRGIATASDMPDYVAMDAPKNQGARTGLRAYLGTIPDYAQGDTKGVKLSGVSPVGPAAKAGVKAGDVIIRLGGKDITNIYDYTYVMGDLKIGEPTTITVQRGSDEVEMKITPGSRD